MFEGNQKPTCKERDSFHRKKEYQKEKKILNFPYDLRALFLCVQMFSYATFSARIIVLSGRNVGERALLYVQRCFTNKSYASEVVMSQEGNSRPQPQPDSPRAAQSAYCSHSGFLSKVSGLQDSGKCHPFSSLCLPYTAAFCTVVCRAKAELYCLYVHLLNASGM